MPHARPLLASLLLITLTACGWGYAAETYRPAHATQDNTRVIVVPPPATAPTPPPPDPCDDPTFLVFRYEAAFKQTREVECATGRTLSLTRVDVTPEEVRAAQLQNLPVGQWYLLVNPRTEQPPIDPSLVSNTTLMGLSKRYTIKYFQQLANAQTIIYTFYDPSAP